jgi:hypothetical protein
MFGNNVKIDDELLGRAKECAAREGYAAVEEFIAHAIEKEIARLAGDDSGGEKDVGERLRGLGYIE